MKICFNLISVDMLDMRIKYLSLAVLHNTFIHIVNMIRDILCLWMRSVIVLWMPLFHSIPHPQPPILSYSLLYVFECRRVGELY